MVDGERSTSEQLADNQNTEPRIHSVLASMLATVG